MDADATKAVIVAGRRAGDGFMRLAIFTRELLELTVEARGERASTLLLTSAQISELQQMLVHFGAQLDATADAAATGNAADAPVAENNGNVSKKVETSWNGVERRNTGSLSKH